MKHLWSAFSDPKGDMPLSWTASLQDQTAQNVQSDLEMMPSTCSFRPVRFEILLVLLVAFFSLEKDRVERALLCKVFFRSLGFNVSSKSIELGQYVETAQAD